MICKICGKSVGTIGKHVRMMHSPMTAKEYYDTYLIKPDEGSCKVCGKPCKFMDCVRGYLMYCSCKCNRNSEDFSEKSKQTCLKKYNVEHYTQSDEYKEKYKQTCLEKYGVENISQSEEIKIKKIKTTLKHYGVINPYNIEQVKTNCKNASKDKTKLKQFYFNKYSELYKTGTIYNFTNGIINFHCNICNTDICMEQHLFFNRLVHHNEPCLNCNPKYKSYSSKEKELLKYIKSIYFNTIIENDRTLLNGLELDIYLPDINFALEFNGTYWHADPRFYKADDLIEHKKITAQKIWEKDTLKYNLCKNKNVSLFQIKEYDWDNNKEYILNEIKIFIEGKMNNWQQVTMAEARLLTEQSDFIHQEVDLFDESGSDEFIKKGTGFKFKYRTSFGDPVSFWVDPRIDDKPVSVKEFIEQLNR